MLENSKPANAQVVKHIDRCLSCLACMTTCPSDVHYMHLVDHARKHIEQTYSRPLPERLLRNLLATVLPRPVLFRFSLLGAWLGPAARALPAGAPADPVRAGAELDPAPSPVDRPQVFAAEGTEARTGRAAERLRPAGPGARDQRDDDPAPDPARRRGRGRTRVRLLRRAHPPHGQGAAGTARCQGEHRRLVARARGPGPGCRGDQRLGLRNHGQGLRVHAPGGCRLCREGRPDQRHHQGRHRAHDRARAETPDRGSGSRGRLSLGLLDAAWPADPRPAEAAPERRGLRGQGRARGPSLLRLGRHLQSLAAGDRDPAARAQGPEHRAARAGPDRDRQHRLHHPDRGRHRDPDRAYRGPARLGDRRAGAEGARSPGVAERRTPISEAAD